MPTTQQQLVGKKIYTNGTGVNLRDLPGTAGKSLIKIAASGYLVGTYINTTGEAGSDFGWYLIQIDKGLGITPVAGYIRSDVAQYDTSDMPAKDKAVLMVQETVKNNIAIVNSINRQLAVIAALQKAGSNVTAYQATTNKLLTNLNARQKFITDHPDWFRVNATTTVPKDSEIAAYVNSSVYYGSALNGLGVLPVTLIIWGVIIIAALVLALQIVKALGPHYDQSKADLKISADAEAVLSKLSAADKKIITDQIKDTAEKNLEAGLKEGGGIMKQVGYAALAIGGAALAFKFLPDGNGKPTK